MNNWEVVIPQILAMGLETLREMVVLPRVANSGYSMTAGQRGSYVEVPIPDAVAVREVAPSHLPRSAPASQPTVLHVPCDQWYEAPFFLTDKDMVEVRRGTVPMKIREAVKALANKVEGDGWNVALGRARGLEADRKIALPVLGMGQSVGTPGTTPFSPTANGVGEISVFTTARARLKKALADPMQRYCIVDPDAEANLVQQRRFQDISWTGDREVMINGTMGHKLGVDWICSESVPGHDSSSLAGFMVDGAAAQGAASINIDKGAAAFRGTAELQDDGTTKYFVAKRGHVFKLAGSTGHFMVTRDVEKDAASNAEVALHFSPALPANIADNAVLTPVDYTNNLLMQRDYLAFVTRPFADSEMSRRLGSIIESQYDPVSGLTLRLEVVRQHKQIQYSFDLLWGWQRIRDQFAQRIFG